MRKGVGPWHVTAGRSRPIAKVVLTPLLPFAWRVRVEGLEHVPDVGWRDHRPEPHLGARLVLRPARPAPPHHLRGQGRVHGRLEDEGPLPGDGHDPDRPLRGRRLPASARRVGPGARVRASSSASTRRAPARESAPCTRATPAWPGSRSARTARSSRSASSGPARCSRPTPSCRVRSCEVVIRFGDPIDVCRYCRPGQRPPRAPPDHRRADVRDPEPLGPGVRRLRTRRSVTSRSRPSRRSSAPVPRPRSPAQPNRSRSRSRPTRTPATPGRSDRRDEVEVGEPRSSAEVLQHRPLVDLLNL